MMSLDWRPLRIAHAYGNRRESVEVAARADVDYMEADLWYRAGDIWVRHERRLGAIPLLVDRYPRGGHDVGLWAFRIFPNYYLRLDINPLTLRELLERTAGRRGLLLDLKGEHRGRTARAYARHLADTLSGFLDTQPVIVCGQTWVLDQVREEAPHLDVRYSIEKPHQWEGFRRRLEADGSIRGVCMARAFLAEDVLRYVEDKGFEVFCWTVDDPEEARRLLELGVDGIISNDISLLESLPRAKDGR